jgi:hypothetical protein
MKYLFCVLYFASSIYPTNARFIVAPFRRYMDLSYKQAGYLFLFSSIYGFILQMSGVSLPFIVDL